MFKRLFSQRAALAELSVESDRIYADHGLTGRTRDRPGLDQALAAVRTGDTLVVTNLDQLARSVPDARESMKITRAKGKLRGKKPKLSDKQQREMRTMYDTCDHSVSDLSELFTVSRPTVFRTLERIAARA